MTHLRIWRSDSRQPKAVHPYDEVVLLLAAWPELDAHDVGHHHPERPARVRAALAGIDAAGLRDAVIPLDPRRATIDELSRAHRPEYLAALERFCARGGGALDADTVAVSGSWDTALLAAGASLAAVDALAAGQGEVALVAARPPGHHALADRAMGFCLLNNVAVAAATLAERGERVLVLDWDVHHGNGTEAIFWDDPRVLYVSTHQWPWYPGTGAVSDTGGPEAPGCTVNVPLPPGATGDVLLGALEGPVGDVVARFSPTWVLVSAGFDAHRADPLGELELSAGDFAALARAARQFAPASGRTALVLEGGYDLDAVRDSVGATLAALLGTDFRPETPTSGGPGGEVLAKVAAAHQGAVDT
ncbi:MAG: histone deacetylase family protein [Acidimicrobiales bacterium]